jgi:hypothetical protein
VERGKGTTTRGDALARDQTRPYGEKPRPAAESRGRHGRTGGTAAPSEDLRIGTASPQLHPVFFAWCTMASDFFSRVNVISLSLIVSYINSLYYVRGIFVTQMIYVKLMASLPTRNQ